MKSILTIIVVFITTMVYPQWDTISPGLFLMVYDSPVKSEIGDSKITVFKVDPKYYDFNLLCQRQYPDKSRSAQQWAEDFDQQVVINAGMFMMDKRNCGYMQTGNFINGAMNSWNAMFAFYPKTHESIQIIDRKAQDWDSLKQNYFGLIQSIRMIDTHGNNCWTQQDKKWSVACLAMDKSGNVLMIHCRSPYTMHQFVDIILEGPFEVYNMMYLEGGPEAQIYANTGNGKIISLVGSYETGFFEHDRNKLMWRIPNVIGISKK